MYLMKTSVTMTALLLASALGLSAQSYQSPTSSSSSQQSSSAIGTTSSQSAATALPEAETTRQRSEREERERNGQPKASRYSIDNPSAKNQSAGSTELKYRSNQPAEVQKNDQQASMGTSQASSTQTGVQASTQTNVAVTAETETQVRTVVQQIDAQGPVVVERISTEFADATCTQENARALVAALHDGTSVTLRNEDGQTATFTPTVHLGYGDAYIALAVAVQALHDAGITGCASPAQWQAVLLGGELAGPSVRTTSVTTERFPGVLVLHEQGGWTKVAQTTHVQLNQVVSQANTKLQINNSSATAQTGSTSKSAEVNASNQQNLTPTGHPAGYDARTEAAKEKKDKDDAAKAKVQDKEKNHDQDLDEKKGDMNAPDTENPSKSATPPKY